MNVSLKQLRSTARVLAAQYDVQAVARYVETHCGQEAAALRAQADDLLENRFVFCDRWDMEPCRIP